MTTITQTISAITPSDPRTMTRDQFSTAAPQTIVDITDMVTELNTFGTQANALAAGMSAIATGAALAIPLTFSTTTTDSDPGNGIVRLDNATQNAATTIRTDLIGNDGSTWTDVIALFDDSTSTVKGFITLVDTTNATKWLVFSVASLAAPGGYVNITVTCVASSAANPFANGASLALKFTRNGDKGDTGAPGTGIAPQAVGFTATGGTTPKTLTVDDDLVTAQAARRNAINNFSAAQNFSRATVASHATTADIWAAAGNQINWTGTATTTAFPDAPQAGVFRTLICAGACSFTAGANMLIAGVASGSTVTCAANDKITVESLSTTQVLLTREKYDGTAQVPVGLIPIATVTATGSQTVISFASSFSSTYDDYVMFGDNISTAASIGDLVFRFCAGGTPISAATYGWNIQYGTETVLNNFGQAGSTSASLIYTTGQKFTLEMKILSANSTALSSIVSDVVGDCLGRCLCRNTTASVKSGFEITSASNVTGVFRLYGVSKG